MARLAVAGSASSTGVVIMWHDQHNPVVDSANTEEVDRAIQMVDSCGAAIQSLRSSLRRSGMKEKVTVCQCLHQGPVLLFIRECKYFSNHNFCLVVQARAPVRTSLPKKSIFFVFVC